MRVHIGNKLANRVRSLVSYTHDLQLSRGLCVRCVHLFVCGVENCGVGAGRRSLNAAAWSWACSRSITRQTNYWATDWLVMHETLHVKQHSETTQTVAQYWRRCCTPPYSRSEITPLGRSVAGSRFWSAGCDPLAPCAQRPPLIPKVSG